MSGYHEFMPWSVWVKQPANKDLDLNEQKKKYDFDRNEHLKKLQYYENLEVIRSNMPDGA